MINKELPQYEWVKTSVKAIFWAHNPKVGGSNPPPAAREIERLQVPACNLFSFEVHKGGNDLPLRPCVSPFNGLQFLRSEQLIHLENRWSFAILD